MSPKPEQPDPKTANGIILFLAILFVTFLGSFIGLEMIVTFGLSPYTAMMQFFQRLIVGNTVMQTGFIPAFSLAFVFLVIGLIVELPIKAFGIFAGFTAATGTVLACIGDALKTGYMLHGEGKKMEAERIGRKHQLYVVCLTLLFVILIVFFSYPIYFAQHRIPPVDHVFIATLQSPASLAIMSPWLIGAFFLGWVLQWTKGAGILFATGLLLNDFLLGWMILIGVWLKLLLGNRMRHSTIVILAAGLISGDVMGRLTRTFYK